MVEQEPHKLQKIVRFYLPILVKVKINIKMEVKQNVKRVRTYNE